MSKDQFDIIVIGGGPGGYVCAIRAAQLGLKGLRRKQRYSWRNMFKCRLHTIQKLIEFIRKFS